VVVSESGTGPAWWIVLAPFAVVKADEAAGHAFTPARHQATRAEQA